ncbi:MAG: MFS transporter, partial [Pseudomonadota bacterium]
MRFLRDNARWLSAGGLLVFSSSFGQTYFIALYAGYFRETFALSHADWGAIYAAGTFASAAMMLVVGGLVDHVRIRDAALVVLACFAGVAVLVSQISAVWMLPILIFGLRFCGQGLMGHIGMVGTARWFAARRGRALSIVAMGF